MGERAQPSLAEVYAAIPGVLIPVQRQLEPRIWANSLLHPPLPSLVAWVTLAYKVLGISTVGLHLHLQAQSCPPCQEAALNVRFLQGNRKPRVTQEVGLSVSPGKEPGFPFTHGGMPFVNTLSTGICFVLGRLSPTQVQCLVQPGP